LWAENALQITSNYGFPLDAWLVFDVKQPASTSGSWVTGRSYRCDNAALFKNTLGKTYVAGCR
jgi:hypothetical protein